MMLENLPGRFPFTAGVFPFKRDSEAPTRMFAGEGDAFKPGAGSKSCRNIPAPRDCPPPSIR